MRVCVEEFWVKRDNVLLDWRVPLPSVETFNYVSEWKG